MEKKNKKESLKMTEIEKLCVKEYSKQFYFWFSFDRLELLFTPNEHISDKFTLSILARLWIFKFLKRNSSIKGIFNNFIFYPYLNLNLLFNKKKAIFETLKIYVKIISFLLVHILYLSLIFYYDTIVYDKVMNQWFIEVMAPKYSLNN